METRNKPETAVPGNDPLGAPCDSSSQRSVYRAMKQTVTFILPTRNRKHFVRRAIDSCRACESEMVSARVIVIDGESDDGTFMDLNQVYEHDDRVQLLQNSKSAGFMNTCFQGVELVKSKWVTFMYDDDVLSPYFVDMVNERSEAATTSSWDTGHQMPLTASTHSGRSLCIGDMQRHS